MYVYLSAISSLKEDFVLNDIDCSKLIALESFYSIKEWQLQLIPKVHSFMLDSGAFSFIYSKGQKKTTNWLRYADAYGEFVKAFDIKYFMELDIESIVGLPYVEMLRERIERRAERQCIPVWHGNRGKDKFIEMCKSHDYVAIGGIACQGSDRCTTEKLMDWMIDTAHSYGCKIHGLGYTQMKGLTEHKFDSVDSTTWLSAPKFGQLQVFDGTKMVTIDSFCGGVKIRRLKDPADAAKFNFTEWVKFQQYALYNL